MLASNTSHLVTPLRSLDLAGHARVIDEVTEELIDAFEGVGVVGLDTEGVDLSRLGSITIVQISTPTRCFLLDVLGKSNENALVCWLRELLENPSIVKIVHDCRMDADALAFHLGIHLARVHDTQCWHEAITGEPERNLNDTLRHYRLQPNTHRDGSVYERKPSFWATRPLTPQMIKWASGDVELMFELYQEQLDQSTRSVSLKAAKASDRALDLVRSAHVDLIRVRNPGRFIGRGGNSLRELKRSTHTHVNSKGPRGSQQFMVFYHSRADFEAVKRVALR